MPAPTLQSVEAASEAIKDMLEAMTSPESPGFAGASLDSASLRLLTADRASDGRTAKVVMEMQTQPKMANQLGNLHGGCAATILDNLTSMVLYLHTSGVPGQPWSYLGVSQSISILYLAPVPTESWIDVECSTITVGKSVAVIQCDIWVKDGKGGERIKRTSSGTHTKIDNSAQFASHL